MVLPGGVLRRHQAEITHQLLGMRESGEVPDLGNQDECGEEIYSTQTGECRYKRLHAPVFALRAQRLCESLDASVRIENGLAIVGKGNVLSRMGEADFGKVQLADQGLLPRRGRP